MADRSYTAVAVGAKNTVQARQLMETCAAQADIVELRLDLMDEFHLAELISNRPCPVIVTNRPVREGGRYTGEESARLAVLLEAAQLGADYIDCEADSYHLMRGLDTGTSKVIVSQHNFEGMYADMFAVYRDLCTKGGDIAKIVCTAQSVVETAQALEVMRGATTPVIAIAMGVPGALSRILAGKYGGYLTFAAPVSIEGTAPGQLSVEAMRNVYLSHEIDRDTSVYGYLCEAPPGDAELSALNQRLRQGGGNAVAVPLPVGNVRCAEVVKTFSALGFSGYAMVPAVQAGGVCDELDAGADGPEGVNAAAVIEGRLMGFKLPNLEPDALAGLWLEAG